MISTLLRCCDLLTVFHVAGNCLVPSTPRNRALLQISERDIKQLSILGEGASGRVYKALLTKAGQATPPRFVAVKRIAGLDSVCPRPPSPPETTHQCRSLVRISLSVCAAS